MDIDFVKIDLHIHTPASRCYKGAKDDDEYLKILENAIRQELKVIAITDHNTIEGYTKLQTIKDDLLKNKKSLDDITDSEQSKTKQPSTISRGVL